MRQKLGQHFLRDPKVIRTILAAAELAPEDHALEIGPGKGVLTVDLAPRVRHLTAVELDTTLAEALLKRWPAESAVTIVHEDFLKSDLDALFPAAVRPIKALGNLPYSITSPIFEKLLAWPGWETGVFLIQKEVADRMQSPAGSRTFGILSLAIQLFATVERIMTVLPGAFVPPPEVTSAVVRIRRRPSPMIAEEFIPAYFDLAHGAFAHRRKTLTNSLALHAQVPKSEVEKWLVLHGVSPSLRAEMLATQEYARLAKPWLFFRRETKLTDSGATSKIPRVS